MEQRIKISNSFIWIRKLIFYLLSPGALEKYLSAFHCRDKYAEVFPRPCRGCILLCMTIMRGCWGITNEWGYQTCSSFIAAVCTHRHTRSVLIHSFPRGFSVLQLSACTWMHAWSLRIVSVAASLWAVKGVFGGHLEVEYWVYTQEILWRQWRCSPSSCGVGYLTCGTAHMALAKEDCCCIWLLSSSRQSLHMLEFKSRHMDAHRIRLLMPVVSVELWKHS